MGEELDIYTKLTEYKENNKIVRLIAVRHAESFANTEGKYQGQTYDTDLSKLGKKQAEALARRVKDLGVKKIITSPLKRTYQTAFEVSKLVSSVIEVNDLVIETNHGVWEGNTKDWIKENSPGLLETWQTYPSKAVFPGGEAFTQTFKRVEAFLESNIFEDDTLLVTHDNIVRILVTLANGWTLDEIWKHDIEPAALNFFEINKVAGKNKLKILKLNDTEHLRNLKADLKKHAL